METLHRPSNICLQGFPSHLKEHFVYPCISCWPFPPHMWIWTWGQMSSQRGSFEIQIPCGFDWRDTHFPEVRCGCDCHPVLQVRLWNMARIWDSHESHVGQDHQWLVGGCNLCIRDVRKIWGVCVENIWKWSVRLSALSLSKFSYLPWYSLIWALKMFPDVSNC